MKRGYIGKEHEDADYCFAIVANTSQEAKKLLYELRHTEGEGDWNWIDLRVRWVRNGKVDDLPIGVIEDLRIGVESEIFTYIEEFPCDECCCDGRVQMYKGELLCESCYDKAK